MSEDGQPPFKKMRYSKDQLTNLSKDELIEKFFEQEAAIDQIYSRNETENVIKEEEKMKSCNEASRRETVLVMRLTAKEQELQECLTQISELKQAQNNTSNAVIHSMLLDPAVNLMFQRMKKEMEACKKKLEQAQNDLAAVKFTADSQTGKRLMAKCRQLLQENEELGKNISSGRIAKLEGEIALEKTLVKEIKKSQEESEVFVIQLDEDVEGMQGTILELQNKFRKASAKIEMLQKENEILKQKLVLYTESEVKNCVIENNLTNRHTSLTSNRIDETICSPDYCQQSSSPPLSPMESTLANETPDRRDDISVNNYEDIDNSDKSHKIIVTVEETDNIDSQTDSYDEMPPEEMNQDNCSNIVIKEEINGDYNHTNDIDCNKNNITDGHLSNNIKNNISKHSTNGTEKSISPIENNDLSVNDSNLTKLDPSSNVTSDMNKS